jgi:hypothetical protein
MTTRSTQRSALVLYSVWQQQPDGEIDSLDCTEFPRKQTALAKLRELRPHFPDACLVKTVRTVCPDTQKGQCPMNTHLHADTAKPLLKAHTLRLHFSDSPEDQALYAALRASGEREYRTPVWRQIKHQLKMAMGLVPPDLFLLKRLEFSSVDPYEVTANAAAAYVPPPPIRPATTLRVIPGGAETVKSEDN